MIDFFIRFFHNKDYHQFRIITRQITGDEYFATNGIRRYDKVYVPQKWTWCGWRKLGKSCVYTDKIKAEEQIKLLVFNDIFYYLIPRKSIEDCKDA